MKRALLIAALLAPTELPAQPSLPDDYVPSDEYQQCMKQPDAVRGNATAVDLCRGLEQTIQLDRLDEAYDRMFDSLTGWDQVRFYNDQVDWREGLDGYCSDAASNSSAGTDSRAFNDCQTAEIVARIRYIDDYEPE